MEFDKDTKEPIIFLIDEFIDYSGKRQIRTANSPLGGTMRLGEYECNIKRDSLLFKAYDGATTIFERHRHRYEANPKYRERLEGGGMVISGESNGLIEAIEIEKHPFFLAVQFHPEFTSTLKSPNPSILAFVEKALNEVK